MSVDRHPRREHGCGDDHEPQGNADSRRQAAPEQVAAIRPVESLTIHHEHRTGPDARGCIPCLRGLTRVLVTGSVAARM